jgi:serine/threonine protein kinase
LTCSAGHRWLAEHVAESACPECGLPPVDWHLPAGSGPSHDAGTDTPPQTLPYAPPPADSPPWPTIPGYQILGELAHGGMGIVYRAIQVNLQRPVALKTLRSLAQAAPQERARFRVEAQAVARLHHPHIVQIHEFGEHGDLPYFSMELLEGGNLAARLGAGPLPPAEAARLVETLARAVHYAHERHIVHRDLKPANVLLAADGQPRITDFGLAKRLDGDDGQTRTGQVMGTASYMAPEQAEGRKDVGPATDVYALGAILYEALTGRPPFRGETRELTIVMVLIDEPVPPARLRPDLPADLEAACLKCLEKDPRRRYASALDLAEELRRFQAGEPLSVRPPTEWERQARWARRAGYEILELTGCSLVGMVYKARQLSLNRLVTLKTVSDHARAEPAQMARFRAEAEVVAPCSTPTSCRSTTAASATACCSSPRSWWRAARWTPSWPKGCPRRTKPRTWWRRWPAPCTTRTSTASSTATSSRA